MADTVHVPILGNVSKGELGILALAGVAVGGYAWYQHNKKQKQTITQNTPSGTGMTAYGYGAASNQYGYGAYTYSPYAGYGYGYSALENALTGEEAYAYGYQEGTSVSQSGNPGTATTNSQWSQNAVQALTAQGWNGQTVQAALGVYLTGGQLTSSQQQVVQAAEGAEGPPPQEGANGYPPAMNVSSSTGQSGTTSPNTVTVPNVIGRTDLNTAISILTKAGLKVQANGGSGVGNKGKVTNEQPPAGTVVSKGTTVTIFYTGGPAK